MSHRTVLVARHADVRAVLDDPRFTVPPVHDAAPASPSSSPSRREHDLAWLRATAVRFSNGDDHRRRRSVALDLLSGLTPFDLRAEAAARTRDVRSARCGPAERPDTVDDARALVPVAVLGSRLGVTERDRPVAVEAVRTTRRCADCPDSSTPTASRSGPPSASCCSCSPARRPPA
jgi:cytochrome P450